MLLIFMENEEALVLFLLNKTKNRRISFMTMQWNWMENNKTICTVCTRYTGKTLSCESIKVLFILQKLSKSELF